MNGKNLIGKVFCTLLLIFGTINCAFAACDSDFFNQFDFWVGHWNVTTAQGKVAGYNEISKSLDNCVLHEHYKTPAGYEGESFNIYSQQKKQWHQTWVDNSGTLLQLDGGLTDGAMVLTGPGLMPDGSKVTHQITWTPNANGTVRQHWEMSKDNGKTWSTLFDGIYTKVKQS